VTASSNSRCAAMETFYLAPKDARGRRIRKGMRVRVVGVPNLSGIRDPRARQTVEAVFRHIKGQCKKVRGFSRYGFAEIFFKIRAGRFAGWHGVEIEPTLLLVQRRRR
jgi:hypothetical protein